MVLRPLLDLGLLLFVQKVLHLGVKLSEEANSSKDVEFTDQLAAAISVHPLVQALPEAVFRFRSTEAGLEQGLDQQLDNAYLSDKL